MFDFGDHANNVTTQINSCQYFGTSKMDIGTRETMMEEYCACSLSSYEQISSASCVGKAAAKQLAKSTPGPTGHGGP